MSYEDLSRSIEDSNADIFPFEKAVNIPLENMFIPLSKKDTPKRTTILINIRRIIYCFIIHLFPSIYCNLYVLKYEDAN